jgi:hypothetical protein
MEERPMANVQEGGQPAKPIARYFGGEDRAVWVRRFAAATAVMFVVSSAFPVVAGLSRDTSTFPKWWGVLDVAVAFVLAFMAIGIFALTQGNVGKDAEDASYRAYRILIHGIFAMNVVFFLFGDRIVWINCLTGFAWRAWLLLYTLPAWFAAVRPPTAILRHAEISR